MKTAETKYKIGYAENTALFHDRGTSSAGLLTSNQGAIIFNPWYSITQGDSVSNREGDEIYPRGMSLRLMYRNELNGAQAQFVRVIVAVIPRMVGTSIMDGSNFDLLDQAGSNDTVTGMIKKEGIKVLYDRMITLKAVTAGDARTGITRVFKQIYIKSKRGGKLKWGQDGLLQNKPVGVWVVPYDYYDTLRSVNLGYCSFTYKMYFKDI